MYVFACVWCVYLYMYILHVFGVCACLHLCVHIHVDGQGWCQVFFFSSISHHLVHQDSGQFSSLACSGDPLSLPFTWELQVDYPAHSEFTWVVGIWTQVLLLDQFYPLNLSSPNTHTHMGTYRHTHTSVCMHMSMHIHIFQDRVTYRSSCPWTMKPWVDLNFGSSCFHLRSVDHMTLPSMVAHTSNLRGTSSAGEESKADLDYTERPSRKLQNRTKRY